MEKPVLLALCRLALHGVFCFSPAARGREPPGAGAVKNTNGGVSNMDAETQRQTPKLRTNLDTNFLKLFAILTMVVDHVGTSFSPSTRNSGG